MKKGFILLETIVVIMVLCVILVMLYSSYSNLLVKVKKKSLYDNTEYIYKTNIVRKYLESEIPESDYNSSLYYVVCRNSVDNNKCYSDNITGNYENDLFKFLKVEAVYIMLWDTNSINANDLTGFEATTQNYIKSLDPTNESAFRIVVMYEEENNDTDIPIYEYASLRFGSRG